MRWQKVKLPAIIANHRFDSWPGECLMCGAKFMFMTSADDAGMALSWNGVGRVDDMDWRPTVQKEKHVN